MMPEEDERVFGDIYRIYNKYRWKVLQPDDFIQFHNEIRAFAALHKYEENPLTRHLGEAICEVIEELYTGGKVPQIPDYFGRSDL